MNISAIDWGICLIVIWIRHRLHREVVGVTVDFVLGAVEVVDSEFVVHLAM